MKPNEANIMAELLEEAAGVLRALPEDVAARLKVRHWLPDELEGSAIMLRDAAIPPAKPDMRAICEALGFDPTNHHNAAKCPYCRPSEQPEPAPATEPATCKDCALMTICEYPACVATPPAQLSPTECDCMTMIHPDGRQVHQRPHQSQQSRLSSSS